MISIHALLAESDSVRDGTGRWIPSFLTTLSLRRATSLMLDCGIFVQFLSTLSLRRATMQAPRAFGYCRISIHALLAESDCYFFLFRNYHCSEFLSTLSLRRATCARPPRGPCSCISIHALLAESDDDGDAGNACDAISIHALLAESDLMPKDSCTLSLGFLSTLSLRRATILSRLLMRIQSNFYPRSPCGERPCNGNGPFSGLIFLSTLSLRRATDLVDAE